MKTMILILYIVINDGSVANFSIELDAGTTYQQCKDAGTSLVYRLQNDETSPLKGTINQIDFECVEGN